ncbi:MAG: YggT family protein [Chloroflexota bacterium]
MCISALLITFIDAFVQVFFGALTIAIFIRVILSWVQTRLPLGIDEFVFAVTEPVLGPIRRMLPAGSGMDFSPLIALIAIQYLLEPLVLRLLPAAVPCLP